MRAPGSVRAVLCTLHHTTGQDGLEELEGLEGGEGKEDMFQCPQQCPGVQGGSCTKHRAAGRMGEGAAVLWAPLAPYVLSPRAVGVLGTRHPSARLQQFKGKARAVRLLQLGGSSGHDSTHRVWSLQGPEG